MRKFLILVLAGLLGFVSCSKQDEDTGIIQENTLVGAEWNYSFDDFDYTAWYLFRDNGTYRTREYNRGSSEPIVSEGTYSIEFDRLTLSNRGITHTYRFTIEEETRDNGEGGLQLAQELTLYIGDGQTVMWTRYINIEQ